VPLSILNAEPLRFGQVDKQTLYRLSLDRCFSYVCADVEKRQYFLDTLQALPITAENVLARQAVIADFVATPTLLSELQRLMYRFKECRDVYNRMNRYRKGNITGRANKSQDVARTQMQASAIALKSCLLFVKSIGELLSSAEVKSSLLSEVSQAAFVISQDEEFLQIVGLCGNLENFSITDPVCVRAKVGFEGKLASLELINRSYVRYTDPNLKSKKKLFSKAESQAIYPSCKVDKDNSLFYQGLLSMPFFSLSTLMDSISGQIFDMFLNIANELIFYEVALLYREFLISKGISFVNPSFNGEANTSFENLYDLFLLATKQNASDVIPHSLSFCKGMQGIVVFGNNGSGKTVFLRSIGIMQILGQAGLPVPAEKAMLRCYNNIMSQFAEGERVSENKTGRFEQEVKEISDMLDCITPETLILFNETFQTTAYDEGAEGLSYILKFLSSYKVTWILVSHLRQLERYLHPEEAAYLTTTDNYGITEGKHIVL